MLAHASLLAAGAVLAVMPTAIGGFYYHPRMVATVHLVTLGWITAAILGSLYMVLPMALRAAMPASRLDLTAFVVYAVGLLGMVSHFWLDLPAGMVWGAGMVLLTIAFVSLRAVSSLRASGAPGEVTIYFQLGALNILLAAGLGILIGLDKLYDLLPGFRLHHVAAHAHLAVLGWATFMVMGAGYRLLPMFLPSALPRGTPLWAGALVSELGVLGLAAGLYAGSRWALLAAVLVLGGLAAFLGRVRWMLEHSRPPAQGLRRPDFGLLHVGVALVCLVLSAVLGALLAVGAAGPHRARVVMAYGVLALLGFLAQMIVGVASRLMPLFSWMREFAASEFREPPPSPHARGSQRLRLLVFVMWLAAVPGRALGLAFDWAAVVRAGGACVVVATAAGLENLRRVLAPAGRGRSSVY